MSKSFKPLAGLVLALCAGLANASAVSAAVGNLDLESGKLLPSFTGSNYAEDGVNAGSRAPQTFERKADPLTSFKLTGPGLQVESVAVRAIPEPSSLALMVMGLGIIATLVRRRRRL